MNPTQPHQGETWMDPEEMQTAADLARSFQQHFADRQITESPFLTLRVQDCLLHHTLCRRLERNLATDPEASAPAPLLPSLAEHIGKSRDRFRKSLKDLEDSANKLTPPPPSPDPASKTSANGKNSEDAKPYNPLHDAKYIQNLIEEVGIDMNDEDFFADEDNFYDVPPYTRPDPTKATQDSQVAPDPTASEYQHPTFTQNPDAARKTAPTAAPSENPEKASPTPAVPSPAADTQESATSIERETAPKFGPPNPHSSHSSHDSHPAPAPCPPLSNPSQPPPKVFIYKVKPTPFNQTPRKK